MGHGLVATVTYTGGAGGPEAKKKIVYQKSTSNFGGFLKFLVCSGGF